MMSSLQGKKLFYPVPAVDLQKITIYLISYHYKLPFATTNASQRNCEAGSIL
jgi:hypothetical protein